MWLRWINSFPLANWDEAWYAEISRNMASGEYGYFMPFWNGQYFFDKPPLYFWLTTATIKLFGVGEWQMRLVSYIAGLGVLLFLYLIGRKLFNTKVGIVATIIFLTLNQVLKRFTEGNLDSLLILTFLGCIYFYLKGRETQRWGIISGIFFGLGLLVKGWFLGLYPLGAIFILEIVEKRNIWKITKNIGTLACVGVLVAGWWYLAGAIKFGKVFTDWYFLNPLSANFVGAVSVRTTLILDFVRDVGIWWFALLFAGASALKNPHSLSLWIAAFAFIIPSSLFTDNLGWHILPAYPFVALGLAVSATELKPKILVAPFVIAQIAFLFYINRGIYDDSLRYAKMGLGAKCRIPNGAEVVLASDDFPTFLYYSGLKSIKIYKPLGGKPFEWWVIDKLPTTNYVLFK